MFTYGIQTPACVPKPLRAMDWEWLLTLGPVARAMAQVDNHVMDLNTRGMLQLVSRATCKALREAEDTLRLRCSSPGLGREAFLRLVQAYPRATKLELYGFAPPLTSSNTDWEHGNGLAEANLDLLRAAPPCFTDLVVHLNPVSLFEPAVSFRRLAAACNPSVTRLELVHPESYYFRSLSMAGFDGHEALPLLRELVISANNMLLLEEAPVALPAALKSIRWSKVWSFWQDPPNHLQLLRMAAKSLVQLDVDMNSQDLKAFLLDDGGIPMPALEHLAVRSSTPTRNLAAEIPHMEWLKALFPRLKTLRLCNLAAPKDPVRLPQAIWASPDGEVIMTSPGPPTPLHTRCLLPLTVADRGPVHPSSA